MPTDRTLSPTAPSATPASLRCLASLLLDATGDGPRARRALARVPSLPADVAAALAASLRASVDPTARADARLEAADLAVPLAALAANLARHLPEAHEALSGKKGALEAAAQLLAALRGWEPDGENDPRALRGPPGVGNATPRRPATLTRGNPRSLRNPSSAGGDAARDAPTCPNSASCRLTPLQLGTAHVAASPLPAYLSVLVSLLVVDAPSRRQVVSRRGGPDAFLALAKGVQACVRAHGGQGMARGETELLLSLALRIERLARPTTKPAFEEVA